MQKLIFSDGVEYAASDFTFWATALNAGFVDRTKLWAGAGGVWTGGVVATVSGLTASVSGPFKGHANGELIQVTSPANLLMANGTTNYVIATYATSDDTPATYYGAGSPPNKRRNDAPAITVRQSGPAIIGNNEIDLATVTTSGGAITLITDTRILLPQVDNSGNLVMGSLKTVDGVDVSVHAAQIGNSTTAGHVKLGAAGGATPYSTLRGDWLKEEFIDVGAAFAATKILDDADFGAPPASSQPFAATGLLFLQSYVPTRQGDLLAAGYGPRVCTRYTLTFTATGIISVPIYLTNWDDTVRIKANGVSLFSSNTPNNGTAQVLSFNTVIGSNTIQVYLANVGGNQYHVTVDCDVLTAAGVTFTG
jgi:hypothetical protein